MDNKRELRTAVLNVTSAGTAEPLSSVPKHVWQVRVKATAGNTGIIYIGDSTVSSANGYSLSEKEEIDISAIFAKDNFILDLNEIYIDSSVNGEGVSLAYLE